MNAGNGASGTELTPVALARAQRKSRFIALVILGAPVALFSLSALRAVQLAQEGEVPAAWRDLNCDGRISFAEWLRGGIDFRLRPSPALPGCQEIYAVKTGAPVALRCAEPPQCRLAREAIK